MCQKSTRQVKNFAVDIYAVNHAAKFVVLEKDQILHNMLLNASLGIHPPYMYMEWQYPDFAHWVHNWGIMPRRAFHPMISDGMLFNGAFKHVVTEEQKT